MPRETDNPLGVRLIIVYKLVRGGIALVLAVLLGWAAYDGGQTIRAIGQALHDHFTGAWSIRLAHLIMRASSQHALEIGAAALSLDGLFTLFEGWALWRRLRFAPWLVVGATASLLPFEVYRLAHGIRAGRLFLLGANLVVVLYLVTRQVRSRVH